MNDLAETPRATPKKRRTQRLKPSSLAIVERGFRGALEEQYGNIVWLSECMRAMQANHNLLLCGAATACAFDSQKRPPLVLQGIELHTFGHLPDAVRGLLSKGARIWVLQKDLEKFPEGYRLIDGVEIAPDITKLILAHDKNWFW